jgi:hypothetical protein
MPLGVEFPATSMRAKSYNIGAAAFGARDLKGVGMNFQPILNDTERELLLDLLMANSGNCPRKFIARTNTSHTNRWRIARKSSIR